MATYKSLKYNIGTEISGEIATAAIADNAVTTAKIAADAVTDAKIADDVVGTEHLTAGEVDTTALGADSVTAAKIADDVVNSEHFAAGSIDNEHIADDAIDSEHYAAGSIDTAHIAADQITAALIADDVINSEHIVDGSVDDAHLASGITSSKLSGALPAIDGSNLTGISSALNTYHEKRDTPSSSRVPGNITVTLNFTVPGTFTNGGMVICNFHDHDVQKSYSTFTVSGTGSGTEAAAGDQRIHATISYPITATAAGATHTFQMTATGGGEGQFYGGQSLVTVIGHQDNMEIYRRYLWIIA